MSLLKLTDDELTAVFETARTLPRCDRDLFLKTLASELDMQPVLGPGIVHRIAREIQQRLFATD